MEHFLLQTHLVAADIATDCGGNLDFALVHILELGHKKAFGKDSEGF